MSPYSTRIMVTSIITIIILTVNAQNQYIVYGPEHRVNIFNKHRARVRLRADEMGRRN